MKNKGFTLIELLIVIAVLGILIVAILSALDPLEQIRKARDAGRKSDAAEMLSAYERYYTTYNCYPWDTGAPKCTAESTITSPTNPDFTTGGNSADLILQGELKDQFANRDSVQDNELWFVEEASTRQVSVCFEPESRSGRQEGQGPTVDQYNQLPATCSIPASPSYPDGSCYVCVPQ